MAAVCRCFPGKNTKSGGRVPSPAEIDNCADWLQAEIDLLKPDLILPVGKLAINQLLPLKKLKDVIGKLECKVIVFSHQNSFFKSPLPCPLQQERNESVDF